jgi:hypothetical protein
MNMFLILGVWQSDFTDLVSFSLVNVVRILCIYMKEKNHKLAMTSKKKGKENVGVHSIGCI